MQQKEIDHYLRQVQNVLEEFEPVEAASFVLEALCHVFGGDWVIDSKHHGFTLNRKDV